MQATGKEQKKLADKERKLLEKAYREKEAALRDDDNVFDVSYESQAAGISDVLSATDIKASHAANAFLEILLHHLTFHSLLPSVTDKNVVSFILKLCLCFLERLQ